MSKGPGGVGSVWFSVLERFERHAPASVMARLALEHALPSSWVD
jgi:IS4 transposase